MGGLHGNHFDPPKQLPAAIPDGLAELEDGWHAHGSYSNSGKNTNF